MKKRFTIKILRLALMLQVLLVSFVITTSCEKHRSGACEYVYRYSTLDDTYKCTFERSESDCNMGTERYYHSNKSCNDLGYTKGSLFFESPQGDKFPGSNGHFARGNQFSGGTGGTGGTGGGGANCENDPKVVEYTNRLENTGCQQCANCAQLALYICANMHNEVNQIRQTMGDYLSSTCPELL